jgi:hypothetical protein
MMARRLAAAVLVLAALPPGDALARSPDLWATVNICDTAAHPDMMGVRARMPGDGSRQQMYMRFRAYYFTEDGRWLPVGGSADSAWLAVGSARYRSRETGFTFSFDPPPAGRRFVVRGRVDFQWRERRRRGRRVRTVVVRRERLNTRTLAVPVDGSDPPGYSNGICEIR